MKPKLIRISSMLACCFFAGSSCAFAANIAKATSGTDLSDGASWTGGTAPGSGDVATWNNATNCLGGTLTLGPTAGTTTTWGGMKVTAASAAIVLTGGSTGQTLDFGATGIEAGSKNVTLGDTTANTPTVNISADQAWTINLKVIFGGANLTVGSGVTSGGWTINLNNNSSITNPQLDFNGGGTKIYDLTKAKLTGIGFPKLSAGTLKLGGANDYDGVMQLTGSGTCEFTTLANAASASSFGDGAGSSSTAVFSLGGVVTLRNTGAGGGTDRPIIATNTSASNLTIENNGSGAISFNSPSAIGGTGGINTLSLKGTYGDGVNAIAQSFTAVNISKAFDVSNWSLSGNNTVTGAVTVSKGYLELASATAVGSAPITIDNAGGELRIGGGLTLSNTIKFTDKSGGGSRFISVTSGTPVTYSGEIIIEEVPNASVPPQINFAILQPAAGATLTVNGKISGVAGDAGLNKRGEGTLVMASSAADITYTGETRVQQGTVRVDTVTGTGLLTVSSLDSIVGVVTGLGTVRGAATFSNGAVISPGNTAGSVGVLNFASDLTVNAAGAYTVDVTSGTTCDKVNVTGNLIYSGTLTFNPIGHTFALGDSYDVADAATITGAPVSIVPATPGAGLAWDTSAFATTGVISVVAATGYDTWAGPSGYNLTGNDALRASDPDGDGFTNLQEFLFGTNPTTGTEVLSSVEKSGTDLVIRWKERTTGCSYQLKESATLANDWINAVGGTIGNDGAAVGDYQPRIATIPIGSAKLFFRVEGIEN